ncbi:MFS transporter, DHA1 family, arabinose polymer transporter [Nocardioides terrae]|uniref:MFS transporter, DHA1 family, arabinose polymer transporter n=1 Tax=Nocardioides terrae TaxID=574651 RepID=A0A1I1LKX3_9ACTN|nr:MFS transporter [Nocardioides terrae]SFC73606.1 MFS transporter, DHA1 family, arabinose polymer transporter [Nocardioides terrae]
MTVTTELTAPPERTAKHAVVAILALGVGGFAIGTTEFVTMGVLPQIADGVDVSVPTAGHIISAYALGVVVGVPLLSFFVAHLPRKGLLLSFMATYAAFNVLSAAAPSYPVLMVARFVDGLPHGAYFGIASLVAAGLVSEERRGRAVASVMMGISVANVAGVPAATWLGQHVGWRATYLAAALLAALTVALIGWSVPRSPGNPGATGRSEARGFFSNAQVWLTMAAGAAGFGGMFAIYSYIGKIVPDVAGLSEHVVPVFVLVLGLGMVVGTLLAGELARWSVFRTLLAASSGSLLVMLLTWLVAPHGWLLLPAVFLVTVCASILAVNLQIRLMDVSGDAVTLGAAMNHATLNIANAAGAYLGGVVIAWGFGYRSTALVGATLAVFGIALLGWSAVLHRRTAR